MAEYTYLVGAEDVKNAGHSISSAADRVSSAAESFNWSADRLHNILDEHVTRIETALIEHADQQVTLRDRFAMAALPIAAEVLRLAFKDHVQVTPSGTIDAKVLATIAYEVADAMLAARNGEGS